MPFMLKYRSAQTTKRREIEIFFFLFSAIKFSFFLWRPSGFLESPHRISEVPTACSQKSPQ